MGQKITGWVATLGLLLVIISFALKMVSSVDISSRSVLMVLGFTMMLLGTIWRVVLEMNEEPEKHQEHNQ